MEAIDQKGRMLVADLFHLDVAVVTGDLLLRDDLGADSLGLAELIVTLGRTFADTAIFDQNVQKIKTVGEIVTYIHACQPERTTNGDASAIQ